MWSRIWEGMHPELSMMALLQDRLMEKPSFIYLFIYSLAKSLKR